VLSGLGRLLLAAAAVPGCVGGPGLGDFNFADNPQISNLRVRPLTPTVSGRTIRWQITAQVADRNNDVIGGTASVEVLAINDDEVPFGAPESKVSMVIVESDFTGDRLSAILVLNNAPAGEISLYFQVTDLAGNSSISEGSFDVRISGRSAPGSVTRPEELRGALLHG
jgi:hypothetical protein